ncbi:EamA family transporter [Deinococcus peraridilitoris]|uniref:EamA-like transporter family n=1 Tax=Deinococcus peraridilitoris (strain DSM 19664 / LMG 22246 / CIP 109416 / KR-200) TaxID=937777 RepID=K9ZYU5_DEIPD|nr:EamA family transporter [Deinococcus peraridilitoris]AFZ66823.1 EamA-like transporter family [Deinococcus peraridilitoris DSM 19664]
MPLRSFLLALLITFIWGVNFVVIKLSVTGAPPLFVAALRFALAALPAVFLVPFPRVPWRVLTGYGLAVGVVQFGLLYLAIEQGLSAGLASLLIQVQAFFTALLSALVLRERLAANQLLGMLLAFAGMALIGLTGTHHASLAGLGLVLLAALGWAVSNLLVRAAGSANMLSLVVWSALIPPVPLTLLAVVTEGVGPVWSVLTHSGSGFWAAVAFMGYFNTVLGFGVWSWLIQRHGAARVAPMSLLVPVFGLLGSSLYFQETFGLLKLFAALLIFAGLLLHVFGGVLFPARVMTRE